MEQNSDDRLSDLPDDIVHSFLSHLSMKDLTQLSAVSKRCRELCILNPKLCVEVPRARSESSQGGFYDSVDRLIALRSLYKVKTQCFDLVGGFQPTSEDEEDRMWRWLQHAVDSGVEDIYLEINEPRKRFSLPAFLLGCKTLISLEINSFEEPFELPSPFSIPSFGDALQNLILCNVSIDNESVGEWFSSLKSLRWLQLEELKGIKTISITNSSLETLIIEIGDDNFQKIDIQKVQRLHHLFIDWNGGRFSQDSQSMKISAPNLQTLSIIWDTPESRRLSLKIRAPNLQRFQWFGYVLDDYYMQDSPNLSYASVGLLPRSKSRANHASTKDSLEKVLYSIRGAKSLTLWNDFVQVLYMHGCLPFLFSKAEHLVIRGTLSASAVKPLCSLLGGTAILKRLILMKNLMPSTSLCFERKYWESQYLPYTHLPETVVVEFFDGKNEVEQIKYVLEDIEEVVKDAEEFVKDEEEVLEDEEEVTETEEETEDEEEDEEEDTEDEEELTEDEEEVAEIEEVMEDEEKVLEDDEVELWDEKEIEIMAIFSTSPISQDFSTEFKEFMIRSPTIFRLSLWNLV